MQKLRLMVFIIFIACLCGCTKQSGQLTNPTISLQKETGETASLTHAIPNWPDARKDENIIVSKTNGTCVFTVGKYAMPSTFFIRALKERMPDATFSDGYAAYTIPIENGKLNAISRIMYCDYNTYVLSIACPSVDKTLLNASCTNRKLPKRSKVGMIANPPNEDIAKFTQTVKEARNAGVDVLYWYFSWKELADNWTVSDYIMEPLHQEGRTAVLIDVIHTNVLGRYPYGFSSFEDEGFRERFADFSTDFVDRYKPEYYFIGNEVDDYFWDKRDGLASFKTLLQTTRKRIKTHNPDTKVGVTVTYHDAIAHNATDIAKELSDAVDIIGYTDYAYHDTFVFDNLSRGVSYLNGPKSVVPGKPFAIVETGWSSSKKLGSSEEKQAAYVLEYFRFVNDTDAEFVNWFDLYDTEDCTSLANTFVPTGMQLPEEYMETFKEFLCNMGLKTVNGKPKLAWYAWLDGTKN